MRASHLVAVALLAGAFFAAIVLLRGQPETPETRIRAALMKAQRAAEAQDLGELMAVISERVLLKGMDRDGLRGFLFLQLRRGSWRKVLVVDTAVQIEPGDPAPRRGSVVTDVALASGANVTSLVDLAGTEAAAYRLRLTFELEDDDAWRVVRGDYERVTVDDLLAPADPPPPHAPSD